MNIDLDCHVHTNLSSCAEDVSLEKFLDCAQERGIERFAITDHSYHIYFDQAERREITHEQIHHIFREVKDQRADRIARYIADLESHRDKGVRVGMELDMLFDRELMFDWRFRDRCEIIIGAVHIVPSLRAKDAPMEQIAAEYLELVLSCLEYDIDIFAHPTRRFQRSGLQTPKWIYDPIIEKAVKENVALEINSHSTDPDADFVRRCLEKGATIALGTDTHAMREFGDFSFHRKILAEAGFSGRWEDDVFFRFE